MVMSENYPHKKHSNLPLATFQADSATIKLLQLLSLIIHFACFDVLMERKSQERGNEISRDRSIVSTCVRNVRRVGLVSRLWM